MSQRALRDNSLEQIEAMQHVSRECCEIDSNLGPLGPLGYPAPSVSASFESSGLLLWVAIVVLILACAWAGIWLGWWAAPYIARWLA